MQQQLRKVDRLQQAANTSNQDGASQDDKDVWEETLRNIPASDDETYYTQEAQLTVNVLPGKPEDVPTTLFDENRRQVQHTHNRYQSRQSYFLMLRRV